MPCGSHRWQPNGNRDRSGIRRAYGEVFWRSFAALVGTRPAFLVGLGVLVACTTASGLEHVTIKTRLRILVAVFFLAATGSIVLPAVETQSANPHRESSYCATGSENVGTSIYGGCAEERTINANADATISEAWHTAERAEIWAVALAIAG